MKLLFKQRLFSWFDSYDIYDEAGETVFTVKGKMALGHQLEIYDRAGGHVGTVKQELLSLLPRFALYQNDQCIGQIKQKMSFFKPVYTLDLNGWKVEGNIWEWEYKVTDENSTLIMMASKKLMNLTDTYMINVIKPENTLLSLMIVLAIDAAKCSNGD
ncbi:MAG: LURP-one-related family protein [Eubacterium sp.]